MKKLSKEDKIIERFEEIFENKIKKLKNTILLDNNIKQFYPAFITRGRKSIRLANFIYNLSLIKFDKEFLDLIKNLKIKYFKNPNENFYDWVIEAAYYGMYDLATAAIAKEGFKSTTHYTTRLALEYIYCIKGKEMKKLFKIYDRVLLKRKLIQDLKKAQDKREIARYQMPELIAQKDAEDILNDAKEFAKEILPIILESKT